MKLSANEQAETQSSVATPVRAKRNFSGLSLRDAMGYVGQSDVVAWEIVAPPREPSAFLTEALTRFDSFSLTNSEAAKLLLVDILFTESLPQFPRLRAWKGEPLDSETLTGVADMLIAPKRTFVETPLLCAVEAKKDSSGQDGLRCIGEMTACRANNERDGYRLDVYGVGSNGQTWQFYRLEYAGTVHETPFYTTQFLPQLLAALHYVCAACDCNLPLPTAAL